ncbi:MAG: prepilin-type N-terminal cleavage/methylation domain-containing protein [Nitrososphaeria archaeon]
MKRKGLTLIELAISIALMSLVVLWSINIFNNIGRGSSTTSDMEIATMLGSQKIEELKGYTYSELLNQTFPLTDNFSSPYSDFSYRIDLSSGSSSGDYYIRSATISIYKGNSTTPLIRMDANFVRRILDGANIGL